MGFRQTSEDAYLLMQATHSVPSGALTELGDGATPWTVLTTNVGGIPVSGLLTASSWAGAVAAEGAIPAGIAGLVAIQQMVGMRVPMRPVAHMPMPPMPRMLLTVL